MTIQPIRITGDPVLHTVAAPVTEFDASLRTLVADMFETMDEAPGVGLAGPQVGVPLRLFVYQCDVDVPSPQRGVAINPTLFITPPPVGAPDVDAEAEGCLSVPGERFPLRRAERAVLTAVDLNNDPIRIEAHGWFARVFQHEFDHLNGILYVDRLASPYAEAAAKVIRKSGWGKPGYSWLPGRDGHES